MAQYKIIQNWPPINYGIKFQLGSTAAQGLIDPLSSHSIPSILHELSVFNTFFLLIFSENRMKDLPGWEQNVLSSFYSLVYLCFYIHPGILFLFTELAPYILSYIFSLIFGPCTSIFPLYSTLISKILKLKFISIGLYYKFICI